MAGCIARPSCIWRWEKPGSPQRMGHCGCAALSQAFQEALKNDDQVIPGSMASCQLICIRSDHPLAGSASGEDGADCLSSIRAGRLSAATSAGWVFSLRDGCLPALTDAGCLSSEGDGRLPTGMGSPIGVLAMTTLLCCTAPKPSFVLAVPPRREKFRQERAVKSRSKSFLRFLFRKAGPNVRPGKAAFDAVMAGGTNTLCVIK
jgi:hypothetical protein